MKHYLFFLFFFIILGTAEAQIYSSVIKVQTLELLLDKEASIMLEKRINGNSSMTFTLGLGFDYEQDEENSYALARDYSLDVSYRRFMASILDDAPKKFYLGVNAVADFVQFESGRVDDLGTSILHSSSYPILGIGLSTGYQFIIRERFAFDIGLAPVVKIPIPSDELKSFDSSSNNVFIELFVPKIGIGIAIVR